MNKGILAAVALMFLVLGGAGAYFFLVHQPNKPDVRYIQVTAVAQLPEGKRELMLNSWKKMISNDAFMKGLIEQSKIASKWGLSEEATLKELRGRLHLKLDTRNGFQVGFKGKRKERADLSKLSEIIFLGGAQTLDKSNPDLAKIFKSK